MLPTISLPKLTSFPAPHTESGVFLDVTESLIMDYGRDMPVSFSRLMAGVLALKAINSPVLSTENSPVIARAWAQLTKTEPTERLPGVVKLNLAQRTALLEINEQLLLLASFQLANSMAHRAWERDVEILVSAHNGHLVDTCRLPEAVEPAQNVYTQQMRESFTVIAALGLFEHPVPEALATLAKPARLGS